MGKMRTGMIILLCALLVGCTGGENEGEVDESRNVEQEENEAVGNDTEESGNVKEAKGENAERGELVSAGEFMDYYGMEEGEIPEDYLEDFISYRQLTKGDLSGLNYDVMAGELYERGVTFGKKVTDLLAGEETELSKDDDFSDVAYVVMLKEVYVNGTDMAQMRASVLEVESGKVFVTDNVTNDYEAEECVRELSNGEVSECFLELRDMITEEWNTYHSVEGKKYDWRLHIVKENGSIISFSGEGPDEKWYPGFMQWCEDYME